MYVFTYGIVARKVKVIFRCTSNLKPAEVIGYSYFGFNIAHNTETSPGSALTIAVAL
jgi:hypothetical protein